MPLLQMLRIRSYLTRLQLNLGVRHTLMLRGMQKVHAKAIGGTTLIALALLGCASNQFPPPRTIRNRCEWQLRSPTPFSAGMQILSATTQAMFSVGTADSGVHGYILLARGRPNWFVGQLVGGGGHVNGSGPRDHIWRVGSLSYKVVYDPETNTAHFLGNTVWLDTANVLFLDRVDQIGGAAQLAGTACVHEFDVNNPDRTLLADPKTQAYTRARP